MAQLFKLISQSSMAFLLLATALFAQTNAERELREERSASTNRTESAPTRPVIVGESGGIFLPEVRIEEEGGADLAITRRSDRDPAVQQQRDAYRRIMPSDPLGKYDSNTSGENLLEIAEFDARYGLHNTIDAALRYGRDLSYLNYFLSFSHYQTEGVGETNGNFFSIIPMSDEQSTAFAFDLNASKAFWSGAYFFSFNNNKRSLMGNTNYSTYEERAISLIAKNELLAFRKGAFTLSAAAEANSIALENPFARNVTDHYGASAALTFDYLWNENNYLVVTAAYDYRYLTPPISEGLHSAKLVVTDGFKIISSLFVAAGLGVSYDDTAGAKFLANAEMRYNITPSTALFARYALDNVPYSFREDFLNEERPVIITNVPQLSYEHNGAFGVAASTSYGLSANAEFFFRYGEAIARIRTNEYGLYSYERKETPITGIRGKARYEIYRTFLVQASAEYSFLPNAQDMDYYSLLALDVLAQYTHKQWGLSIALGIPFAIVGAETKNALCYPYIQVSKDLADTLAINIKLDNILNVQEGYDLLYPHKGFTFLAGVTVKF